MKFGVRECANIVFRAKQPIRIGTATFQAGQPVLYIDTATTSSMEQSTTTVYAQGGRGNARLLAWEGQKTLTFSFTDALLSPIGFSILSGAGLFKRGDGANSAKEGSTEDLVHFHMTSGATLKINSDHTGSIDLRNAIAEFGSAASISLDDAPIYIMETEDDGSLTGNIYTGTITNVKDTNNVVVKTGIIELENIKDSSDKYVEKDVPVMVDYYIDLPGKHVYEADITPDTFGGNYYVEADTLFRDQHTGKDLPANLTFPNVRLQSNFTMTFAGTGDPSTFDFTMDAFPDYTYFDRKKKVLAVMQIVDSIALGGSGTGADADPVMYHNDVDEDKDSMLSDSNETVTELGSEIGYFKFTDGTDAMTKNLYNINDTIDMRDYLVAKKTSTDVDNIIGEIIPKFNIESGTAVELEKDGHIRAVKSGTSVVSATIIGTGDTDISVNLTVVVA